MVLFPDTVFAMPHQHLHIVPFLSGSPITGKVLCAAGFVSVFRGAPNSIEACVKALRKPGGENAQVYLDSAQFVPSEHRFVGFGETLPAASVIDFLSKRASKREDAERILAEHGLSLIADRPCPSLPAEEQRLLEIFGAMLEPEKVLILHDPFQGLTESRREDLARRLCLFAERSARIVIVTQLSDRPEFWIDNPRVARIDVSAKRRQTIGGGTNNRDLEKLVAQVRQAIQSDQVTAPGQSQHKYLTPLLSALLVAVMALLIQRYSREAKGKGPELAAINSESQSAASLQSSSTAVVPVSIQPTIAPEPVLEEYPYAIQESIRQAFMGTDLAKIAAAAASSVRAQVEESQQVKAQELRMFMGPDGGAYQAPPVETDGQPPQLIDPGNGEPNIAVYSGLSDVEARREQMRQRFLRDLADLN